MMLLRFSVIALSILGVSCVSTLSMEDKIGIKEGSAVRTRERTQLEIDPGTYPSNADMWLGRQNAVVLSPVGTQGRLQVIGYCEKGTVVHLDRLRYVIPIDSHLIQGHVYRDTKRVDVAIYAHDMDDILGIQFLDNQGH